MRSLESHERLLVPISLKHRKRTHLSIMLRRYEPAMYIPTSCRRRHRHRRRANPRLHKSTIQEDAKPMARVSKMQRDRCLLMERETLTCRYLVAGSKQ